MSKPTYIQSLATALPSYKIEQAQAVRFMSRIFGMDEQEERALRIFYRTTGIQSRYSVLADYQKQQDFAFFPNSPEEAWPDTAQRMRAYEKEALPLAQKAVYSCLEQFAQGQNTSTDTVKPSITHLITVSCTGMYAPGLDIELIETLGLSPSTHRLGVHFMGCYASFNALKTAQAIAKSDPQARVLVVSVELCTLHIQAQENREHWVENALFADGAAAFILSQDSPGPYPVLEVDDFHCGLAPQGKKDMAWKIRNSGFEMKLSSYVPDLLHSQIRNLVCQILDKNQLSLSEVGTYAIHPGGKKILEQVEKALQIQSCQNYHAHEVLKHYGNMSSATILFVLAAILKQAFDFPSNSRILSMAFGPGLTIETGLFRLRYER